MKPKFNREVKIGLAVLLVLVLILAGVVVRRFMWAASPIDAEMARAEEKHEEERHDEHLKRETESLPKPAVLTPVEASRRDSVHSLDDPGHWKAESKERKKEAGLFAADPPPISIPSDNPKPRHRDEPPATTYAGPELIDDRYSPAADKHPAEHRKPDGAGSMVIQVSDGEMGDGKPRPLDRYSPGDRSRETLPPAPIINETIPNNDGRFAHTPADPEEERRRVEKERARESHDPTRDVKMLAPRDNYLPAPPPADRDARNGYDPAWQQPTGNAPSYSRNPAFNPQPNNAAAPSGYTPEHAPPEARERHEGREEHVGMGRMRPQNPLRDDATYEVQPNDSFWTISERVYGSGAYFRALAEQNRGKAARPDRLPPGLVISTPPVARLEKDYPDLCPRPNHRDAIQNRAAGVSMAGTLGGGRTYVVQEGDTLSSIARNELGKVSRWAEIYQLNREALGKDFDYLTPGMKLLLPIRDTDSGDRTTRRDEGGPISR